MKNFYTYFLLLATLGLFSCEPDLKDPIDEDGFYSSGEANFTHYVALGNSLTAGYADNALYITGQENSYPNILAQKFALAQDETDEFTQPLVNDNSGGLLAGGQQIQPNRLVLAIGADGSRAPQVYTGMQPSTDITNVLQGPFNNMGVPGAKSYHLVAPNYGDITRVPTGAANPYFVRFASSPSATVLQDALAQNPTFFSLWIGNNDVLGYATSGGSGKYQLGNLDPSTYASNDITDPNVFASVYSNLVNSLTENGAKGVLITIPDVTEIAFFNTVPSNAIPLDEQTAGLLNAQFQAYNTQVLPGLVQAGAITAAEAQQRQINFAAGAGNFVTLQDEDLTDISSIVQGPPFNLNAQTAALLSQLRQATSEDLIPLTASSFLGTMVNDNPMQINGVSVPLEDSRVLTPQEQALVRTATSAYNQTIINLASANNLAVLDINEVLNQLSGAGIPYDGGTVTSTFGTGGAFSLDGVHLTPRGYAIIADRIIAQINATYNASVPAVNIGSYGTVTASNEVQ